MDPKNEKKRFYLMLIIFSILVLGVVVMVTSLFIYNSPKPFDAYSILSILIATTVIGFATFFVIKRKKEIELGIPQYDERSKKIMYLSAARAYYISLYWLLAIMWLNEIFAKNNIPTDAVIGLAIAGMAIIWVICQVWYNKFGDKHI